MVVTAGSRQQQSDLRQCPRHPRCQPQVTWRTEVLRILASVGATRSGVRSTLMEPPMRRQASRTRIDVSWELISSPWITSCGRRPWCTRTPRAFRGVCGVLEPDCDAGTQGPVKLRVLPTEHLPSTSAVRKQARSTKPGLLPRSLSVGSRCHRYGSLPVRHTHSPSAGTSPDRTPADRHKENRHQSCPRRRSHRRSSPQTLGCALPPGPVERSLPRAPA